MPNSISAAQTRRNKRVWVSDDSHPKGGYWYAETIPPEEHGQFKVYNNWYCRCPSCTEANRLKFKTYYAERRKRGQSSDAADE